MNYLNPTPPPNPKILLHPNIPKPLHGVNPRTLMGDRWWDTIRHQAYNQFNRRCHACGLYHSRLDAHESYEINYTSGRIELQYVVALCRKCHLFIHDGFVLSQYQAGIFTLEFYKSLLKHGHDLLRPWLKCYSRDWNGVDWKELGVPTVPFQQKFPKVKIEGFDPIPNPIAPWEDWHLVIGDRIEYSPFRNIQHWKEHYANLNRKTAQKKEGPILKKRSTQPPTQPPSPWNGLIDDIPATS